MQRFHLFSIYVAFNLSRANSEDDLSSEMHFETGVSMLKQSY